MIINSIIYDAIIKYLIFFFKLKHYILLIKIKIIRKIKMKTYSLNNEMLDLIKDSGEELTKEESLIIFEDEKTNSEKDTNNTNNTNNSNNTFIKDSTKHKNKTKIKKHLVTEKIHQKFFKACERGEIEKVKSMLDKKLSKDRKPDINHKYLYDYTVLHISITNSKNIKLIKYIYFNIIILSI
jgi:hypothetical protein